LGWYHSHPNYGPWLSGIDVNTQTSMQQAGPMLAIVVDPIRSKISGRIDIGAFRTCSPEKNTHVVSSEQPEEAGTIPEDKIKDFGVHYKHYYKLDLEYFISEKDFEVVEYCWSKFWKTVLETDRLIDSQKSLRDTLRDLVTKAEKYKNQVVNIESLLEKKSTTAQVEQNLKHFIKHSMELSQCVHQDCLKGLAFK